MDPGADVIYCVFIFPDSSDSRYLRRLPREGTRVRSPEGEEWFVSDVLQSGQAVYTVFCVGRREYQERFGHTPGGPGELAADLLERAQESVSERRRRWKYRHYIP